MKVTDWPSKLGYRKYNNTLIWINKRTDLNQWMDFYLLIYRTSSFTRINQTFFLLLLTKSYLFNVQHSIVHSEIPWSLTWLFGLHLSSCPICVVKFNLYTKDCRPTVSDICLFHCLSLWPLSYIILRLSVKLKGILLLCAMSWQRAKGCKHNCISLTRDSKGV